MTRYLVLASCMYLLVSCNDASKPCISQETLDIINEYDNRDSEDPPVPPLCDN